MESAHVCGKPHKPHQMALECDHVELNVPAAGPSSRTVREAQRLTACLQSANGCRDKRLSTIQTELAPVHVLDLVLSGKSLTMLFQNLNHACIIQHAPVQKQHHLPCTVQRPYGNAY